jgi:hypothetical protein
MDLKSLRNKKGLGLEILCYIKQRRLKDFRRNKVLEEVR